MAFESFRRTAVDVEPIIRPGVPESDPLLRNEIDPDPLIEEMVSRLREGLSSLHAVDEWGRPLAWRNVVRLALGPLASRLRDTEQALEIAVSMIPQPEEPLDRRVGDRRVAETDEAVVAAAAEEDLVEETAEPVLQAAAEPAPAEPAEDAPAAPQATVDVILPAVEAVTDEPVEALEVTGHAILVEEPIEVDEAAVAAVEAEQVTPEPVAPQAPAAPVVTAAAVPVSRPLGATSLFTVSGDQRAVPVSPFGSRELLGGGSPDDSTAAKYDRFLTGLYGERKQMGADEDGGSGRPGLGNNL